jgi:hypothetical protein
MHVFNTNIIKKNINMYAKHIFKLVIDIKVVLLCILIIKLIMLKLK